MDKTKEDFSQDQHLSVEYHRSYRKLHYGKIKFRLLSHLLSFAIIAALILIFLDKLSFLYSKLAYEIIRSRVADLDMQAVKYFFSDVWLLMAQGSYPSHSQLVIVALVSIILWIIALFVKFIPLPLRLGFKVLGVLNLIGCIYFWFWADKFPYNLNQYSGLYVSAEIGMWIAIPLLLMFALLPIPVSLFKKLLLVIFTMFYTFVFGFIRYAMFVLIIVKWSFLWMAFLYFIVGVFFDFAFMIAFYSYFISLIAPGLFKDNRRWRWLFSS